MRSGALFLALLIGCGDPETVAPPDGSLTEVDGMLADGALAEADLGLPDAPLNEWVLVTEDSRMQVWETGIAYDPRVRRIVQHGGHDFFDYVQSSYTRQLDPLTGASEWSHAPSRPQRRCIVEVVYIESLGRTMTLFGGSDHGSLPQGGFNRDYDELWRKDPAGPFLYDGVADRWENTRTRWGADLRSVHTPVAYEPGSDAVFAIIEDRLTVYDVHGNHVLRRSLPEPLHRRLGYAIAADPVRRQLVVFGGTGPQNYNWVSDAERETRWAEWVSADTWVYDIGRDEWTEVETDVSPPPGMPMYAHMPGAMIHHPPTRSMLLMQSPLDSHSTDHREWPDAQLWRFDLQSREWSPLPMGGAIPAYSGRLAYDSDHDLVVLLGGGRDGSRQSPSESRQLRTARIRVEGVDAPSRRRPLPLAARAVAEGTELTWDGGSGTYELLRAAIVDGLPASYAAIAESADGRYVDADPGVWAYRLRSVDEPSVLSHAVSSSPPRPGAPWVRVRDATTVEIRWPAMEVAGYRVHRQRGQDLMTPRGTSLAPSGSSMTSWTDIVDISDGVARHYWVTAVDRHGRESGPSPVAHSFPDAPERFDVEALGEGRYRLSWTIHDGSTSEPVQVWHSDAHENTLGWGPARLQEWWDSWQRVTPEPSADGTWTVELTVPREHHYFYARTVNALGQLGFRTDIVSATDERFAGRH